MTMTYVKTSAMNSKIIHKLPEQDLNYAVKFL